MRLSFTPTASVSSFDLPNGLRVFLKPDNRNPLVSVQAWVRVGSIDETTDEAGLSHVLEHMVFKGTEKRSAVEISRWVESLGGSMNAETSKEYTHYYIDVPRDGAHQAVDVLSELLFKATLESSEWRREGPVVLEEIKRRNDDPEAVLWDLLNQAVFDDERLQRPVIGFPETIRRMSAADVMRFYKRHYTAGRTLLVIAGDFDLRTMERHVRRSFEAMPATLETRLPLPVTPRPRSVIRAERRPVRQAYLALGLPTPPAHHADHEGLDLLAAILGEGRSSRLVRELREKRKLVWSVSAVNLTHEGPGLFAFFMDCDFKNRAAAVSALQSQLKRLLKEGPTEDEITRAKNLVQTAWLQGYETYHHQASTLGSFAIDGHLNRLKKYLPSLLSVRKRDLNDLIERYLGGLTLATAVVEA